MLSLLLPDLVQSKAKKKTIAILEKLSVLVPVDLQTIFENNHERFLGPYGDRKVS